MIIEMSWLLSDVSGRQAYVWTVADQCSLCIALDTMLTRAERETLLRLMMFG